MIGLFRVLGRIIAFVAVCAFVAGCAETELLATLGKEVQRDDSSGSGSYKVGNPYQINGQWYLGISPCSENEITNRL